MDDFDIIFFDSAISLLFVSNEIALIIKSKFPFSLSSSMVHVFIDASFEKSFDIFSA